VQSAHTLATFIRKSAGYEVRKDGVGMIPKYSAEWWAKAATSLRTNQNISLGDIATPHGQHPIDRGNPAAYVSTENVIGAPSAALQVTMQESAVPASTRRFLDVFSRRPCD
jgi:hypothetical protein